ncbi:MAG TPA: FmdB family zinc ribbon protein [Chloroflexia bacterium]|nr:FmdB family zinc ribbon protein [Chloroflexia bacterium]
MPIYEYECRSCHRRFERMQSFHDETIRVCPECGGVTYRVFQAVGVIFKGSGWYKTDSRAPAPAADTGKATEKPAEAGTAAAGDDKPAAAPAAATGKDGAAPAAAKGGSAPAKAGPAGGDHA